jgi:hypothetical protein
MFDKNIFFASIHLKKTADNRFNPSYFLGYTDVSSPRYQRKELV